MSSIAVCALTFHRPGGLARLLACLDALEDPAGASFFVVIVDNDPEGSARSVVEEARRTSPRPIVYEIEPERGIPFARNRCVEMVGELDADFIAFIDDDEKPDRRWLAELVAVQQRTGADVVTGPVIPLYEPGTPEWIATGGYFERPRFTTGERVPWATTSSVLIALDALPDTRPFDERMRLTGGSDTDLFLRMARDGRTIVWADEAEVFETIPLSRARTKWVLQREYRRGNTLSICLRHMNDSRWRRLRRIGLAAVRIAQGMAWTIVAAMTLNRRRVVWGLRWMCFGSGLVTGLFGREFEEYRTIHTV